MASHTDREHFIPVRKAEMVELLCRQPGLSPQETADFRQLCRLLEAMLHYEYHSQLEALKSAYAPFDPDTDVKPLIELRPEQKQAYLDDLFTRFRWLLERANYRMLVHEDLQEAIQAASDWGLRVQVDFDVFERLEVFVHGDTVQNRSRRRARHLWRIEPVEVPVFQRLIAILRLRPHKALGKLVDTESVFVKMFKDIPKADLDMLLPGTRVHMSILDRIKLSGSMMTGLGLTGWKFATTGAFFSAATGLLGNLPFFGLVGGALGYGIRSFTGYLSTKQKYQLTLTQSLFFLNLDNNAGVLFRLLDEAEEQEFREAILAWYFLWRHGGAEGWSQVRLDEEIEKFLAQAARIQVDFEVDDALDKLKRMRLVQPAANGHLTAVSLPEALRRLDEVWDGLFTFHGCKDSP